MAIMDILSNSMVYDIIFNVIKVIIILIGVLFAIKKLLRFILKNLKIAQEKKLINDTLFHLFQHIITAILYFLGMVIVISGIPPLSSVAIALVTGAGLVGIIVGLSAQAAIGNIISGVSLAIFQPFSIGDYVTIKNEYGKVTDLGLRHTVISTWDNRRLVIPNSVISEEAIINWTMDDPTIIWSVDIGISYDSDIDLARSIMLEEAIKHPNVMKFNDINLIHPEIIQGNEIKVVVSELKDFSVNMKMLIWVSDRSFAYGTACDLYETIKKRFDKEGVEIPFPYRTIVYKKDLKPNNKLKNGDVIYEKVSGNEVCIQDCQYQSGDSNV